MAPSKFAQLKEYARLIGIPHDWEKVILPCFLSSFKEGVLRTLGVKKKLLGGRSEPGIEKLSFGLAL